MIRNRADQRREGGTDSRTTILDFFFQRKVENGRTMLVPRTTPVTRDEMWWFGEWLSRRLPAHNRWYKRLWRWLRGDTVVTYDPFTMVRAHPAFDVPAAPQPAPANRVIDANGRIVDG